MHRRPVGRSSRKEVLQAEQPRGPTHSDPQRISIVSRWHPGPARQTFFAGVLAAFVGFASSFAVVLQGLRSVGASPAQSRM